MTSGGARDAMFLTGHSGTATLPGMSVEFLLTSLVVVLIPGTRVLNTLSSSIGGGRRRGLFAAVGCTLGIVPHVQAGSVVFEAVRWAGVAYLTFMCTSMIGDAGELSLDYVNAGPDRYLP